MSGSNSGLSQVLVVIPTYDERENIEEIVARVRAAVPSVEILVADDNSPDGTGDLADVLCAADPQVHVLHRERKQGLGPAYLAGFAWGMERGFEVLVEMDADGSHQPEQLPRLLAALADADLVLGSRWVPGGKVVNWPLRRKLISRAGTTYARFALGVPIHDVTGGYRAFRASALSSLGLDDVASQGYCFQIDLAWRAVQRGLRVVEVPITFVERVRGESKMNGSIVRESLVRVSVWGLSHRTRQVSQALGRSKAVT
ncbi:polyprenol monophosphomannose synthase [Angustibacter sp. McL0619]|uniref:polyprenol monophosphomannose synthase n=1 Tax=Angustibacter sp. McL0619 TaxID=3415676 RepID=UPI003CF4E408